MTNHNSNYTLGEHTELTPDKTRIRSRIIKELHSDRRRAQGIITISDGIMDCLLTLGHKGIIQVVDIDSGACNSTRNMMPRYSKPGGDYPTLNIATPINANIKYVIQRICEHNKINKYGLLDIDLTATIKTCWNELISYILRDLSRYKYHGRIAITLSVRKDDFHSFADRVKFVKSHLPKNIKYIRHESFRSTYFGRHRKYQRRAPMWVVILQGTDLN
jgi:hypothetical protein